MHLVLFSILCNVTVSVIIKLARRYSVNVVQMIAWNYPAALLLSYYYLRPDVSTFSFAEAPIASYIVLGFLLPTLFLVIATSIRFTGIIRTEIAQRLSLFIPLLAAFFLFNEHPQPIKLIGIAIGFAAIICSVKWQQERGHAKIQTGNWLYPLIVFFGMGIIDILYKHIAQYQAVSYKSSIFIVFVLCVLVSFLYIFYQVIMKKMRFSLSGTLWGLALGIFNFGNIIFYMKAHQALPENPSTVFSAMNIGVIVVGALVGMLLFKERLSTLNKVGLLLAIVSVILIGLL